MKIIRKTTPLLSFHWDSIQGYDKLLDTFLETILLFPRFTHPMMNASTVLLRCAPQLINYYNRLILSRTLVFNLPQVIGSFYKIQKWFFEFKETNRPLPNNFDLPYFCAALDVIIDSDHHQLLQKVIQLLYDVFDVFTGELRKTFVSEFILKKHFFPLFLHWDEIIRNYFQQFLLWKIVRIRSSNPNKKFDFPFTGTGYDSKYFPIDPDVEYNNDLAMLGKIQCYVQVVQDQLKASQSKTTLNIDFEENFDRNLESYIPRAIAEFQYLTGRYSAWEKSSDRDWKLIPLALLDTRKIIVSMKNVQ